MRYFPLAVRVDGHRYTGDWSLSQGGKICVTSAFGSLTAELGDERPEVVAIRTLERIVREDQQRRAEAEARQAHEMARLRAAHGAADDRLAEQLAGDDDPVWDALRRLVEQVEISNYRDESGRPLKMNEAFIEIRELLRGYGEP